MEPQTWEIQAFHTHPLMIKESPIEHTSKSSKEKSTMLICYGRDASIIGGIWWNKYWKHLDLGWQGCLAVDI